MTWVLGSMVVLAFALGSGALWYERTHPGSRVLALVATLAALAALGRVAFAPMPNVKPTTDIVLLAGYVLGGAPGFMVGAVAALASNLFFGQGPWTPWQMAGWGLVGLVGAALGRLCGRSLGRGWLAAACLAAGFLYGAVMNLFLWVTYSGDHTMGKLLAYFATSMPFDLAHALGNAIFCLAFGPVLVRALMRYRDRLTIDWRPALGPAAVVAVAGFAGLSLVAASAADARAPRESISYLLKAQNRDGGFGGASGQRSSPMQTGWAALGLAAAGRSPRDVRRGRRSAIDYLRRHADELGGDLGERTRTVLVVRAAGLSARRFGGRDLIEEILDTQRSDGSFAGRVNTTAFAVLALRAGGLRTRHRAVRDAGRFIAREANPDGGFNFAGRGGPSGIDDTGAALQGLAAAGRGRTRTAKDAVAFLRSRQNRDGGFALQPGAASNVQSTSWAVQGLLAVGQDPDDLRRRGSRTPLQYLRSLVGSNGAVRYSRTSTQTPVWVTAQAVAALAEKAFPLSPVRRSGSRRARKTNAEAASAASAPAAGAPAESSAAAASGERSERRRKQSGAGRDAVGSQSRVGSATPAPVSELASRAHSAGIVVGTLAWPLA